MKTGCLKQFGNLFRMLGKGWQSTKHTSYRNRSQNKNNLFSLFLVSSFRFSVYTRFVWRNNRIFRSLYIMIFLWSMIRTAKICIWWYLSDCLSFIVSLFWNILFYILYILFELLSKSHIFNCNFEGLKKFLLRCWSFFFRVPSDLTWCHPMCGEIDSFTKQQKFAHVMIRYYFRNLIFNSFGAFRILIISMLYRHRNYVRMKGIYSNWHVYLCLFW